MACFLTPRHESLLEDKLIRSADHLSNRVAISAAISFRPSHEPSKESVEVVMRNWSF
jgi:hypothetical protein